MGINILQKRMKNSGQSTAFPFNNVLAKDSLERSSPKGLVTGLLMGFFVASLEETISFHVFIFAIVRLLHSNS